MGMLVADLRRNVADRLRTAILGGLAKDIFASWRWGFFERRDDMRHAETSLKHTKALKALFTCMEGVVEKIACFCQEHTDSAACQRCLLSWKLATQTQMSTDAASRKVGK